MAKDSHILSMKNKSVFVMFMFEILLNLSLTKDVINFEQLGPDYSANTLSVIFC